jgi:hypothetical protein
VNIRQAAAATALLFCLLALASCGGDGGGNDSGTTQRGNETSTTSAQLPKAVIATANGNCEAMLREVNRIGRESKGGGYETALELTTKGFAEPGLKQFKDLAKRQQQLQDKARSEAFDAYAASFDPIIVLAEQWLEAQRAADITKAGRLQQLLTDLGAEQQILAKRAGLPKCSVSFFDALVRSATS